MTPPSTREPHFAARANSPDSASVAESSHFDFPVPPLQGLGIQDFTMGHQTQTKAYMEKALPPVPSDGLSVASSFRREVAHAFETPKVSMDGSRPSGDRFSSVEAAIVAMLDQDAMDLIKSDNSRNRGNMKMAFKLPPTPPGEILAPQPRKSVPKILRMGSQPNSPISPSATSPSTYNPPHKIRQIMGTDINSDDVTWGPPGPVSPLTPASSRYSQDELEDTISEPDESLFTGWEDDAGYVSDSARVPRMSWASQPGFVPESLHINKARKASITSGHLPEPVPILIEQTLTDQVPTGPTSFVRFHREPKQKQQKSHQRSHQPSLSSSSVEYHISAAEIAYATTVTFGGIKPPHRTRPSTASASTVTSRKQPTEVPKAQTSTGGLFSRGPRPTSRLPKKGSILGLKLGSRPWTSSGLQTSPTIQETSGAHQTAPTHDTPKSAFDYDDSDGEDVKGPTNDGNRPSRRLSVMDRVFRKRYISGASTGSSESSNSNVSKRSSTWTRPSSRSASADSLKVVETPASMTNITSAAQDPPPIPPRKRPIRPSPTWPVPSPRAPAPAPPVTSPRKSLYIHRRGDLMEQARAAVSGKTREERWRDEMRKKGIQVISEETARDLRVPPPVPPRPSSIISDIDKIGGNWL